MKALKKLLDAIGPHDTLIIDKYEGEVEVSVLQAGKDPTAIAGRLRRQDRKDCIALTSLVPSCLKTLPWNETPSLKQSLKAAYQNLRKEQGDMGT